MFRGTALNSLSVQKFVKTLKTQFKYCNLTITFFIVKFGGNIKDSFICARFFRRIYLEYSSNFTGKYNESNFPRIFSNVKERRTDVDLIKQN